jgi:hypothetical protein
MTTTNQTDEQRLRKTMKACERLARDKSTTKHEREAARVKGEEIKKKLAVIEAAQTENSGLYNSWVRDGRNVVKNQAEANWLLGELATKVEKHYGAAKLEQFAEDIGVNYNTLKSCRATCLAWPEKVGRPTFWIASALNPLPEAERFRIAKEKANLTYREARDITKQFKTEKKAKSKTKKATKKANGRGPEPADQKVWRFNFIQRAKYTVREAAFDDWSKFKVDQEMIDLAEAAAEAWKKVAAYLKELKRGEP